MARPGRVLRVALGIVLLGILFPELYAGDQYRGDTSRILASPDAIHWFGTDRLGRDLFARCVYAGRRSLLLAALAEAVVLLLGTVIGAASGYLPRSIFALLAGGIGAVALSLPFLLLAMVASTVFSARGLPLILAVAAVGWVYTMRIVRGEVAAMRIRPPVLAALAWGFTPGHIIRRIILPQLLHLLPPIALFGMAEIIGIEAGLSFFGIGVISGTPSLGGMLLEGRSLAVEFWWLVVGPSFVLLVLVLGCNVLAQAWEPNGKARA
jgi:peptide/nickel transport system permease protein